MMKWGFALNAGLGALLVASAVGGGNSKSQDLDLSLDRAARGLEELAGLRTRLEHGDRAAIGDVLARSEAPSPDPRTDDERLAQLRFEVSRLQMDWDAIAATLPVKTGGAPKAGTPAALPASPGTKGATGAQTAFEAPGFSADPLREGEALFRAGKYTESLAVLKTQPDDARCQYWSARALEQLGRVDEALAIYTAVAARKDAGWAGERARTDIELLQWKKDSAAKPGEKPATTSRSATTETRQP